MGIIIQARLGSKRYPRKILAPLAGKTVLEQIMNRCRKSQLAGKHVVVACPEGEGEEIYTHTGIAPYEGPENDLLTRFLGAARQMDLDVAIRVTADCPLVCPEMIDLMTAQMNMNECSAAVNWIPRTWPDGADLDVWGREELERLDGRFKTPRQREWWATEAAHKHTRDIGFFQNMKENWSRYRVTLDYPEDMHVVRSIYHAQGNSCWPWTVIVKWLDRHPAVREYNRKRVNNFGDIY